jgi:putative transposase
MVEEMYFEHYPMAKSFAGVWDACQSEGDRRRIKRPSYYSVCRWIKQRPEKERYEMVMGKEAAEQRYAYRPGYKMTTRPLEWVQIDHTPADVLIVDSKDRTRIIGRPYLSFAICLHTRVVLGFYVSFLHPSSVTVAKLLETCVLPKHDLLKGWGVAVEKWPMHGVPEVIHTDNAKEFVSQVFELNAKEYGIEVLQRPIGEKHFGGHIESLIGKMTKKLLHALPGTTGANTVERKRLESEHKATVTIERLRRVIVLGIHAYHETKHSELDDTPANFWNKYQGSEHAPRVLPEQKKKAFRYCFYPEKSEKLITPDGIELFRRFYNHAKFDRYVREKVLVKFDPYDVSYVMVKLAGEWIRAECTRNPFERSSDYERYRWERQQKGERNGTTSKEGAESRAQIYEEVAEEKKLTAQAKRQRKREVGIADYKRENRRLDKSPADPSEITKQLQPSSRSKKKSQAIHKIKPSKGQGNVIDINAVINRSRKADDDDFVIYDMDRR